MLTHTITARTAVRPGLFYVTDIPHPADDSSPPTGGVMLPTTAVVQDYAKGHRVNPTCWMTGNSSGASTGTMAASARKQPRKEHECDYDKHQYLRLRGYSMSSLVIICGITRLVRIARTPPSPLEQDVGAGLSCVEQDSLTSLMWMHR